jgi:hypothetical protein
MQYAQISLFFLTFAALFSMIWSKRAFDTFVTSYVIKNHPEEANTIIKKVFHIVFYLLYQLKLQKELFIYQDYAEIESARRETLRRMLIASIITSLTYFTFIILY